MDDGELKPGDIFIHAVDLTSPAPRKVVPGVRDSKDGTKWYMAIHYDCSQAPSEDVIGEGFLAGEDGIRVKLSKEMAAISCDGVKCWLSDLPFKRADQVDFSETGAAKRIKDMKPGQIFMLGEEILMYGGSGYCYSMSGVVVTCLPWDKECALMEVRAKWDVKEEER